LGEIGQVHDGPALIAAGIQRHLGYIAEIDARVHQLALNENANLQPQRLRHPVLMVLPRSMFGHGPSSFGQTIQNSRGAGGEHRPISIAFAFQRTL
jgi:hypothetical protein